MSTQKRNHELYELLRGFFVPRNDPSLAWAKAVPGLLYSPEVRGVWPMSSVNESGNAYDLSGQGRTLTNNNSVAFGVDGLVPYADFTRASSMYFSRTSEAGLAITGALWISFWVYFDSESIGNTTGLFTKWQAAGTRQYIVYKNTSNTIIFGVSSDGTALTQSVTYATAVTSGTWYHVAAVYEPSTRITLFVNGNETETTSSVPASIFNGSALLALGQYDGGVFLDGRMSLPALGAFALPDSLALNYYHQTRKAFGG